MRAEEKCCLAHKGAILVIILRPVFPNKSSHAEKDTEKICHWMIAEVKQPSKLPQHKELLKNLIPHFTNRYMTKLIS